VLDFLVVKAVSRLKFLKVIGKYAKGRFREISDIITHIRGKTMSVDSETDLAVNIDGEIIYTRSLSFTVLPRHLHFLFPEGFHFHGSNGSSGAVSLTNGEI
jgi:diacylglycerol kinase family enzyme